jgi:hypothetical protein
MRAETPDREMIIKGLYQHCEGSMFDRCGECPYYEVADEPFRCRDALLMDVLALLREQEPVKPNKPGTAYKTVWSCGVCSHPLTTNWVACPSCGKKVKWDAAD